MEISDISEETQVTEGGCGLRYMSKKMLEMSLERSIRVRLCDFFCAMLRSLERI